MLFDFNNKSLHTKIDFKRKRIYVVSASISKYFLKCISIIFVGPFSISYMVVYRYYKIFELSK